MRYFGNSIKQHFHEDDILVAVPEGKFCQFCGSRLKSYDDGVYLTNTGNPGPVAHWFCYSINPQAMVRKVREHKSGKLEVRARV